MSIAVLCDVCGELSETFVLNEIRALRRQGHDVSVVAVGHPRVPHRAPDLDDLPVTVLNDLRPGTKAAALARLVARRPRRAADDLRDRGSWLPAERPRHLGVLARPALDLARRGVEHVHAHFAARASLEALRTGRLLGVPVSITAHAHDIFRTPRNLERKLRSADVVTTPCRYNLRHLRSLVEPEHAARIHEIVIGVDARVFRRTLPHPGVNRVLAVGRLVEKKGFADLVDAAARLRDARVTIVGDGPLEEPLRRRIAERGVGDRVELAGARTPDEVRALLEDAAVLAMPCVVAADGDRDAMPVVVKEALAMEVPVVATDEVGLPELVDDACGRLVAPHDAEGLARALGELLALTPEQRAALGRAGRERVVERCDVHRETAKLVALFEAARR